MRIALHPETLLMQQLDSDVNDEDEGLIVETNGSDVSGELDFGILVFACLLHIGDCDRGDNADSCAPGDASDAAAGQ